MSSGILVPNPPTSRPASAGPTSTPTEPAVWLSAVALGRSSRRTISGTRAAIVGWVTASPQASSATSAMMRAVPSANASAKQIAACPTPAPTRSVRLSTRSASRPVSGARTTSGRTAASIKPETASPPAPAVCRARASAVAARKSPQVEIPRAPAAR
jgi:hypothetical protein